MVMPGDALELGELLVLRRLELLLELPGVRLAVGDALLAPLELGRAPLELALLARPAAPATRSDSACRALTSRSSSSRSRTDSSFASSCASRRSASASRRASWSSSWRGAPCRGEPRAAGERQVPQPPAPPPTTRPMRMPITIAMPLLGRRSCGGCRRAPSAAEPARTHPANRCKRTATARVALALA